MEEEEAAGRVPDPVVAGGYLPCVLHKDLDDSDSPVPPVPSPASTPAASATTSAGVPDISGIPVQTEGDFVYLRKSDFQRLASDRAQEHRAQADEWDKLASSASGSGVQAPRAAHLPSVSDTETKCPICDKVFKFHGSLVHHMETIHGQVDRVKCTEDGCNKTFATVKIK